MISIAIPTYEMNGFGLDFLDRSIKYLLQQTLKDFEVVVSDHSVNNDIKNYLKKFKDSIKINYIKNNRDRGNSSANINNAMNNCNGEIIKILFQDEYLYSPFCLEQIQSSFEKNKEKKWLLNGCLYGESPEKINGSIKPRYSKNIIMGINTIGSPSVLSILNESRVNFDENLIWLMDCEFYKKCYDLYKLPIILDEPLIFVSQHKNQLTNLIPKEIKNKEYLYIKTKYNIIYE